MGRIPFPDLLAPQEQSWYQQRTIPGQLGVDDYFFAREHQMSLQREYEMQRQVIPRATGLTRNAFLEHPHRDRESVERLEWLHRMIALYGRK
jgi:25S rRNA (uracil2634-N3)-methyltransferase